jgi:hypothetical protein
MAYYRNIFYQAAKYAGRKGMNWAVKYFSKGKFENTNEIFATFAQCAAGEYFGVEGMCKPNDFTKAVAIRADQFQDIQSAVDAIGGAGTFSKAAYGFAGAAAFTVGKGTLNIAMDVAPVVAGALIPYWKEISGALGVCLAAEQMGFSVLQLPGILQQETEKMLALPAPDNQPKARQQDFEALFEQDQPDGLQLQDRLNQIVDSARGGINYFGDKYVEGMNRFLAHRGLGGQGIKVKDKKKDKLKKIMHALIDVSL